MNSNKVNLLSTETIERSILLIRGQKIILDVDLARLYGVQTRTLNQAVRRNYNRFPEDFVFQLTEDEKQEVITICDNLPQLKYAPNPPYAFTEHGAIMAASILNSTRAIQVSVYVVRVFIKLRHLLLQNKTLNEKMSRMELKLEKHDTSIRALNLAFRELTEGSTPSKRKRIGF